MPTTKQSSDPPPSQPIPLLSVVAEPPPRTTGGPDDVDTEPSVFIDGVLDQIRASTTNPQNRHTIKMASSVARLRTAIVDFANSAAGDFDMQIIGHAESGFLDLGQAWRGQAAYFDGLEYWRLNSNPDILNILKLNNISGRFRKVTFAGCQVGNPIARDQAANGTMLLFTFEQLWNCRVRGAVGPIAFNSFNPDTGAFAGEMRTWNDAKIDDTRIVLNPKFTTTAIANVRFRELVVSETAYQQVPSHLNYELLSAYVREREDKVGPILASPQFEFLIEARSSEKTVSGRARISMGGSCLTIVLPEPVPAADQQRFTQIGSNFYRYYYAAVEDVRGAAMLDTLVSHVHELSLAP